MKRIPRRLPCFLLLFSCLGWLPAPVDAETARAEKGMVATVHPLATDAGVAVLEKGGNAVDAAIAARYNVISKKPWAFPNELLPNVSNQSRPVRISMAGNSI
ncbi:MAG: hypothetical protein QGH11_08190 [Pirellulaceae bacterium]|nr:hypothetical protein [Pirellulaceae bacterium]